MTQKQQQQNKNNQIMLPSCSSVLLWDMLDLLRRKDPKGDLNELRFGLVALVMLGGKKATKISKTKKSTQSD